MPELWVTYLTIGLVFALIPALFVLKFLQNWHLCRTRVLASVFCDDNKTRRSWVKPGTIVELPGTPGDNKKWEGEFNSGALRDEQFRILRYQAMYWVEDVPGPITKKDLLPYRPSLESMIEAGVGDAEAAVAANGGVEVTNLQSEKVNDFRPYWWSPSMVKVLRHVHVLRETFAVPRNLWAYALFLVIIIFGGIIAMLIQQGG